MNLPNKITIFRVILIPVFLVLLYLNNVPGNKWMALAVFVIASLSDMVDGKIARKYNMVTDFGKFMDPLADKLLVSAALIALIEFGRIPAWIVIIIISREFIISGFRLIAADNGIVIAAGWWGKVKTAVTMVMLCIMIPDLGACFPQSATGIHIAEQILVYLSLALTVLSLIDYLIKNKGVIKTYK